jgi:hypothetical protein
MSTKVADPHGAALPRGAAERPSSLPIVVATSELLVQPPTLVSEGGLSAARAIVQRLRSNRATWGSLLEHGVVVRCDAERFEVAYERRSFLAAQVSDPPVAEAFARAARDELGAATRILVCDKPPEGKSLAAITAESRIAADDAARTAAREHPVVQDAIAVFGGVRIKVKLTSDN